MIDVQGRCPACGDTSLFLAEAGYVTCSRSDCPSPDAADALLRGSDTTLPARCPSVEIRNALSERLDQLPDKPIVFAGGTDSRLLIDGTFYAVSSEHPVVLDPFGPGISGGRLTLTLTCDRVTIDGKEIGDA
jgi:hypothetical protein